MFRDWLETVDKRMVEVSGMSIYEMGDYRWRDAYDGGDSPDCALRDALDYWVEWGGMPEEIADFIMDRLEERIRKEMETHLTEEEKAAGGILHLRAKQRALI